eukprot:2366742-Rhodomonas_salina.1
MRCNEVQKGCVGFRRGGRGEPEDKRKWTKQETGAGGPGVGGRITLCDGGLGRSGLGPEEHDVADDLPCMNIIVWGLQGATVIHLGGQCIGRWEGGCVLLPSHAQPGASRFKLA